MNKYKIEINLTTQRLAIAKGEIYFQQQGVPNEILNLIIDLQQKIDKAIEYIEKDRNKNYGSLEKKSFYCSKTNKLLEILKGEK